MNVSDNAPVFNDATRSVLEDIFLLKRLATMQQFFKLCSQVAQGATSFLDDDHLNKPIRRFTADYVSRQLLGVTSQTLALALCLLLQRIGLNVTVEVEQRDIGAENKVSLEELCRKAVDLCMKRGQFSGGTLSQASGLTSTLEGTWRRREVARNIQQQVEAQRSTLQRLQLQLTAHNWLHEDILMLQGAPLTAMAPISDALVSSVEQRLKWAAGANPALSEVMAAFESAVSVRSERLNLEQRLSTLVGNTCNALLHHEALRTRTSEGLAHDTAFLQLLDQCEKSCALAAGCEQAVTPAEESLVQLLAPDGPIDHTWIHNAELLISDTVKSLQQQMVVLQESLFSAQDNLKSQVIVVRNRLSTHHKLMSDVRNLLKSMVKLEDCGLIGLQDYVQSYRTYSEQFSGLIRELMSEELVGDRIHKALDQLEHLKEKTGAIYGELLVFGKQEDEQEKNSISCSRSLVSEEAYGPGARAKRPPLLRQESVCLSPRKGVPVAPSIMPSAGISKPGRDPHTGKVEKNPLKWSSIIHGFILLQVDYVIREAMSLDNLALLYEGWTPWV
ncbi:hypothetical protein C0J52_06894 [Blattella germanica]|nr:hypothetical protein C0J52_06894 [Blattella germanica]